LELDVPVVRGDGRAEAGPGIPALDRAGNGAFVGWLSPCSPRLP
jgi:hypothetical protein